MNLRIKVDLRSLLPRLPAFIVVAAAALFIAWLIVRTATVSSLARSMPLAAARAAPEDPRVVASLVEMDLRTRMGVVRPSVKRKARAALVRAPLMAEPFLLAGIDQLVKRDNQGAHRLLAHALARNGRSRLARLFMLELELRAGAAEAAAANMTILGRLMPDVQRVFVPELARLALDPETHGPLRQALSTDPRMHASVLQHLAANGANPQIVLRMAGPRPPVPTDDGTPDWRQTLLDSMVKKGNVRGAKLLWSRFSDADPEEAESLVYDGSFEGLPGLPPFNWSFSSSELGAAERDKSGALFVEYYGRNAGELASQLITLAPGRYRLRLHAEGDLNTPQHRLVWTVRCRSNDRQLLVLPLAGVTFAGRVLAGNFEVPPGCPAQWLRLVGDPTEFPKIENVLIREIRIERIGGA